MVNMPKIFVLSEAWELASKIQKEWEKVDLHEEAKRIIPGLTEQENKERQAQVECLITLREKLHKTGTDTRDLIEMIIATWWEARPNMFQRMERMESLALWAETLDLIYHDSSYPEKSWQEAVLMYPEEEYEYDNDEYDDEYEYEEDDEGEYDDEENTIKIRRNGH